MTFKSTVETDLSVAEAAEIPAGILYSTSPAGLQSIENAFCCRFDTNKEFRPSHPTRGWNDAMEAAEKVGLFVVHLLGNCQVYRRKYKRGWILELVAEATAGPMAICNAILAMKGKE